jgi:hypothetical protein
MDRYIVRGRQYPTICCSVLKQIADVFLKEILEKMDAARKFLSIYL